MSHDYLNLFLAFASGISISGGAYGLTLGRKWTAVLQIAIGVICAILALI